MRMIFPRSSFVVSCALPESCASPTIAYSMPSGPNAIRPPLWYGVPPAMLEKSTLRPTPEP